MFPVTPRTVRGCSLALILFLVTLGGVQGNFLQDIQDLPVWEKNIRFFEEMIAPMSRETFVDEYWRKQLPVFLPADDAHRLRFDEIFTAEDLYEILSENSASPQRIRPDETPRLDDQLRIARVQDGKRETAVFPKGTLMNESLAKQYFDEGWTFTIDRAYEFWGPILEICHLTEQYFHLIASGNLFITPPNAQGFSLHFDGSSVFSLQLEGEKTWEIRRPYIEMPLENIYTTFGETNTTEHVFNVTLRPGDALFIPRGWLHRAWNVGEAPSVHLSLSAEDFSWFEFLATLGLPLPPQPSEVPDDYETRFAMAVTRGVPLPFRNPVPPHLYYYSEGDLAEELQESLIDIYGQVPEDVLTPNGLVFKTQAKGLALEMNTAVAVDHFVFQSLYGSLLPSVAALEADLAWRQTQMATLTLDTVLVPSQTLGVFFLAHDTKGLGLLFNEQSVLPRRFKEMTDEESEALAYFVPTPLGRMLRRFFYPPYPSFRLAALRIGRVTDNTLLQLGRALLEHGAVYVDGDPKFVSRRLEPPRRATHVQPSRSTEGDGEGYPRRPEDPSGEGEETILTRRNHGRRRDEF